MTCVRAETMADMSCWDLSEYIGNKPYSSSLSEECDIDLPSMSLGSTSKTDWYIYVCKREIFAHIYQLINWLLTWPLLQSFRVLLAIFWVLCFIMGLCTKVWQESNLDSGWYSCLDRSNVKVKKKKKERERENERKKKNGSMRMRIRSGGDARVLVPLILYVSLPFLTVWTQDKWEHTETLDTKIKSCNFLEKKNADVTLFFNRFYYSLKFM